MRPRTATPNADANWTEIATGLPGFVEAVSDGLDRIVDQAHQMTAMTGSDAVVAKLTGSMAENLYDVLFLCENDRKDGALRLLRTPFEKYLYAHHMTTHPEAADDFQLFDAIHAHQLMTALETHYGYQMSAQSKAGLDAMVEKARAKFKPPKCTECGGRLPRSWTKVSSDQMAEAAGLASLHVLAFRYSTMFIHPSERGITDQIKDAVKIPSIVGIVHHLVLQTLILQWRRLYNSETMTGRTAEVVSRLVKVMKRLPETKSPKPRTWKSKARRRTRAVLQARKEPIGSGSLIQLASRNGLNRLLGRTMRRRHRAFSRSGSGGS